MSLVGFKSRNHPQQSVVDAVDDRATTPEMFAWLASLYGPFTLDVAAASHNTKCDRFFTKDQNGLVQPWSAERVWCNPPFSKILPWVFNAHTTEDARVTMLLPANRCEQKWWQRYIEPFRDGRGPRLTTHFLGGRMRFMHPAGGDVKPNDRPPFGVVVCVWESVRR